jgi:hypothetical protein
MLSFNAQEWEVMPDLYFFRSQEEQEREQAGAEVETTEYAAPEAATSYAADANAQWADMSTGMFCCRWPSAWCARLSLAATARCVAFRQFVAPFIHACGAYSRRRWWLGDDWRVGRDHWRVGRQPGPRWHRELDRLSAS